MKLVYSMLDAKIIAFFTQSRKLNNLRVIIIMIALPFLLGIFVPFLVGLVLFYFAVFSTVLLFLITRFVKLISQEKSSDERKIDDVFSALTKGINLK